MSLFFKFDSFKLIWLGSLKFYHFHYFKKLILQGRERMGATYPFHFSPCGLADQNSANVCPCACRKRWQTKGYKLSYTTGLLLAWPSCMQWGVWVWKVGHWVVLVQVIYCSKGGSVLFFKEPSGEEGWFVIFQIFKSILFFVNWISLYFFHFI